MAYHANTEVAHLVYVVLVLDLPSSLYHFGLCWNRIKAVPYRHTDKQTHSLYCCHCRPNNYDEFASQIISKNCGVSICRSVVVWFTSGWFRDDDSGTVPDDRVGTVPCGSCGDSPLRGRHLMFCLKIVFRLFLNCGRVFFIDPRIFDRLNLKKS